jgi:hypothetical protein
MAQLIQIDNRAGGDRQVFNIMIYEEPACGTIPLTAFRPSLVQALWSEPR